MTPELLARRVREAVVNDSVLVGEVASQVAGALGLSTVNATLGRKVVSLAIDAQERTHKQSLAAEEGVAGFIDQAGQYGSFSDDLLREVHRRVGDRMLRASHLIKTGGKTRCGVDISHAVLRLPLTSSLRCVVCGVLCPSTSPFTSSSSLASALISSFPSLPLHSGGSSSAEGAVVERVVASRLKGGLLRRPGAAAGEAVFTKKGAGSHAEPRVSLLGLDRLAKQKRMERGVVPAAAHALQQDEDFSAEVKDVDETFT